MKNANSNLKKALGGQLALSILLTLGLPVGIVFIIIGAINMDANVVYKVMLGIGITLAVLGFYASPIARVKYGPQKKYQILLDYLQFM